MATTDGLKALMAYAHACGMKMPDADADHIRRVWMAELADVDDEAVLTGARRMVRDGERFLSLPALFAAMTPADGWTEAWAELLSKVARGRYAYLPLDDEAFAAGFEAMGGYHACRRMPSGGTAGQRAAFRDAYRAHASKGRLQLAANSRGLLDG